LSPGGSRFDTDLALVASPDLVDDRARFALEFNQMAAEVRADGRGASWGKRHLLGGGIF
jgi:hypothetical protein